MGFIFGDTGGEAVPAPDKSMSWLSEMIGEDAAAKVRKHSERTMRPREPKLLLVWKTGTTRISIMGDSEDEVFATLNNLLSGGMAKFGAEFQIIHNPKHS